MTRRARRSSVIGILVAALCACLTPPAEEGPDGLRPPEEAPVERPLPPEEAPGPEEASFDPRTVTEEVKTATMVDVRSLIARLNGIIQRQDYEGWVATLTEEYRLTYSDPAILSRMSDSAVLKSLGIRLYSLRDYFLYVVYPSRQDDRADDVEFLGEDHIRAITISPKGERLVLYNLERINDTWKIGIGR